MPRSSFTARWSSGRRRQTDSGDGYVNFVNKLENALAILGPRDLILCLTYQIGFEDQEYREIGSGPVKGVYSAQNVSLRYLMELRVRGSPPRRRCFFGQEKLPYFDSNSEFKLIEAVEDEAGDLSQRLGVNLKVRSLVRKNYARLKKA
jgi:hypothetical protein